MKPWPLERDCNGFYGNPASTNVGKPSQTWMRDNLVGIIPPFRMTYDGKPVRALQMHKKCAESLARVLSNIWQASGNKQQVVDQWGASIYGGGFNFRLKRGFNSLSMHSWGCAIDLDPARNAMGDITPNFANAPAVVAAFEDEGWVWGGRWKGKFCDGMHFQAARLRDTP